MSRSDELRAQLEAELAVAELEEQLVTMKADKAVATGGKHKAEQADEYREVKARLRAARQRFRDLRAGVPVGEGDAVASPGAVEASAKVEEVG